MGIKYLNKFLKENTHNSIRLMSMSELSGKKIAVDISIYMYKYESDETLIENMYLMLSIFRYYNIIAIFVFDGKPPNEKKDLLQKRRENKKEAEEEFRHLKKHLTENANIDENERQEIINNMDILKKQFVYINKDKIELIKNLIRSYGETYYDAPGEADELCAQLVIENKVWACLSEDMDLFVYGCTRVLRYMSLLNHTAIMYDLKGILEELGITQKELREICVISGTDYNIKYDDKNALNLYRTLKLFKKYHKQKTNSEFDCFYDWIKSTDNFEIDIDLLMKIYNMFDLTNKDHLNLKVFDNIKITNGAILKKEMKEILMEDGFIFPVY